MTFHEVFEDFMQFAQYEYSPHTIVSKKSAYKTHIRPLIGAMHIEELKYSTLQSVLNAMLQSGKSPKTVSHSRDIIRTTFKHAVRCEFIVKDPSVHLLVKKIDNRRFLSLTKPEITAFVSAVKNEPDVYYRALFMFLLHGRRLNEARQLQWSWIDFSKKSVCIPALHSKDRYVHHYAISDELLSLLKILPRLSDYVFVSKKTGSQFVCIKKPFARILKRAGIDKAKMRIHDIRHLVGTSLIDAGKTLEDVKYTLGHNSITTSMRYVTVNPDRTRGSIDFVMSLSLGVSDV